MAQYKVEITSLITGGPFTYIIYKDNVGQKSVIGLNSISAALDGVKADIGTLLGSETVSKVVMTITSG